MARPIVQSDEELYQLTGSWEEAALMRDAQNIAANEWDWANPVATTPAIAATPTTPAAVEETAPAEETAPTLTYSSTDEQGNPIYDPPAAVAEPVATPAATPAAAETPAAPTGIAALIPETPAAVAAPVVTPPSGGGKLDLEPADEPTPPTVAPVAPTGIAALAPTTTPEAPTGIASLAPTTSAVVAPPAVTAPATEDKTPPTIESLKDAYKKLGATYTTSDITEAGEQVHVQPRDLGGGFRAWEKPGDIIGYDGQGQDATPISAPATLGGFMKHDADKKLTNYYDAEGKFLFAEKDVSLTKRILSDLSPVISMVVPFAGAELASLLNVSAATGTALVNAGMKVAGGASVEDALKGLAVSQLSNTVSNTVSGAINKELSNLTSDPLTAKLITNVASAVTNSVLSGNTENLDKTVLGSVVDSVVSNQTGSNIAGSTAGVLASTGSGTAALNSLVNTIGSNAAKGAGTSSKSTTPEITTLSDEDLAELKPGELQAYQDGGVQGLADFRRSMKNLTSLTTSGRTGDDTGGGDLTTIGTVTGTDTSGNVTLPGGVTLASTGDGVFRTEVGGTPTYADSKNASSVTVPFGYSLLSSSEADDKPEGSYYDITANAWFKPDTAVTNLTSGTTITSDADLFNTSIGDLDKLDDTRTGDDYADFLASIGITNPTQLKDSGLSNQDILDMINASDDTVTVTGSKTPAATGTDTPATTGTSTPTNLGTVTVTDKKCDPGYVYDEAQNKCVPIETVTVTDKKCDPGYVYDEAQKKCVPIETVTVVDKKCPPGSVYDEDLKQCVPIETVTVVDKKCPPGQVYDEDLKQCVPIKTVDDSCPTGFHKDEFGKCVPDTKETLSCPEGFEPNEAGTACIPVVTIVDKKCPPGQVYDEDLKQCVPIVKEDECQPGFEKINGTCVPVCKEGYIRNLATGVCEKVEDKGCPPGQVKNAEGKCVPITKVTPPTPPVVKPPVKKVEVPSFVPSTGSYFSEDKTDPIYAEGMDDFNLFATLEELLAEKPDETAKKKDNKKSKDKTKMATGGHLDDLLAEQMTVDDLLKLLR